jgi:hypothetical protein
MSDNLSTTEPQGRPDRSAPAETLGAHGPVPGRPEITPKPESPVPRSAPESNRPPDPLPDLPRLRQPRRGRRLAKKPDEPASPLTAEQRLLVFDAWRRSGLPAGDFAPLVGMLLKSTPVPGAAWLPLGAADGGATVETAAAGSPAHRCPRRWWAARGPRPSLVAPAASLPLCWNLPAPSRE